MDFRPATGQLYGVGSTSRLYVINQNTGVARAVGAGPFTPALTGDLVGFDFNPEFDRIRVGTNTGQSIRLHPETGVVVNTFSRIAGPALTAFAYVGNAGESISIRYAINPENQQLYLASIDSQGPGIDEGIETAMGSLGLNISGDGGFDIDAKTGTALGLFTVNGKPTLFSVNLRTSVDQRTQTLAEYSASLNYTSIAIRSRPIAYVVSSTTNGPNTKFDNLTLLDPTDAAIFESKAIRGLPADEIIDGLDFRPATGQLYALANYQGTGLPRPSRLYTIDLGTGAVTRVADVSILIDRAVYGFDFNPVTDRIRIVSNSGQNLQVNPTTGVAIAEGYVDGGPSPRRLTAAAYDNNFTGATSTKLYAAGIAQFSNSKLYQIDPPSSGNLVEIGNVGADVRHMDIGGISNTAYALVSVDNRPQLYTINLATGTGTLVRPINIFIQNAGTEVHRGFAVGLGF
jgi:hypothetical protein